MVASEALCELAQLRVPTLPQVHSSCTGFPPFLQHVKVTSGPLCAGCSFCL